MAEDWIERELKLRAHSPDVLEQLGRLTTLGPYVLENEHREAQVNSYFDTRERSLARARLALRRRTVRGQLMATWSVKGGGTTVDGVAARPEVEILLNEDTPPFLALEALRQAARQRGALALAESLDDALQGASPVLARPYLELRAERHARRFRAAELDRAVELALDQVELAGHAGYRECEVEVELRRGRPEALESARAALAELNVSDVSEGSKLSRAAAHATVCSGC